MLGTFAYIFKHNGFLALYDGLSASLLRQMTYSMTRFGVYEKLKHHYTTPSYTPGTLALLSISCFSGILGGIAGNPADVINVCSLLAEKEIMLTDLLINQVRMQSDLGLPPAQRRNYKHAFDGLYQMTRYEGLVHGILRGVAPNCIRAALMTTSQLTTYDVFKRVCMRNLGMKDNLSTHFTSSFLAGFVATTVCSPADVIKTRIMSASTAQLQKRQGLKTLIHVTRTEGIIWAFRGWVPSFIRLGPHTIATFLFLEQHKRLYRYFKGIPEHV